MFKGNLSEVRVFDRLRVLLGIFDAFYTCRGYQAALIKSTI